MCFNPRTRVGCDAISPNRSDYHACFNPRTRVGCDGCFACLGGLADCFNPRTRVGCDRFLGYSLFCWIVSIHAPVWGATPLTTFCQSAMMFQSTHPCGVRLGAGNVWVRPQCFNPRTRVGCDDLRNDAGSIPKFQSTHPCGVRRTK